MKTWICLAMMAISPFVMANKAYTMKDLEILKKHKNYEEFLLHSHDIRPSDRNEQWISMVKEVSSAYVDYQSSRRNYNNLVFNQIEKLADWSDLREDEFFQIKRDLYAKSYISHCFRQEKKPKACRLQLNAFWYNSPKRVETAYLFGKLLGEYFPKEEHWDFFQVATSSNLSEFYCDKPEVTNAIFKRLSPLIENLKNDNEVHQKINGNLNQACWQVFSKKLKKSLFLKEGPRQIRELSFQMLKAKGSLDRKELDLYYTLFVLEGPIVGKTFNEAWHTIRSLGQDFRRRDGIIKKLKSMDPLPGRVFGLADKEKSATLVEFLSQNIPEYLSLYGKTCLDYLEGLKEFPNGNPTIECRDLFNLAKDSDSLSYSLLLRYSKLRKL